MHNYVLSCSKGSKSNKWKFPVCVPVSLNCCEYTWPHSDTDLHFLPHDVKPGFWQWESYTLGKLLGHGSVTQDLCLKLFSRPTVRALSFPLMFRAIASQFNFPVGNSLKTPIVHDKYSLVICLKEWVGDNWVKM